MLTMKMILVTKQKISYCKEIKITGY